MRARISTGVIAYCFIALNLLDALLTKLAVSSGGYEVNPIMRQLLNHPDWIFIASKVGLAALVTLCLALTRLKFPSRPRRILIALTVGMVTVCVINALALSLL